MAKSMIGVAVMAVASTTAIMLSNGKAEETPPKKSALAAAGLPSKGEAKSASLNPEFEKYFGPQTDWPRFRGPMGNGICMEKGLPTMWNAKTKENIVWSTDLFHMPKDIYPLYPYTSPIVYKDRVFVTLATYKSSIFVDPPKDLKVKTPGPAAFADMAEFRLVCFQKSDGKMLWETPIEPGEGWQAGPRPGDHGDECSFDVSVPCTDGERVYVAFGGRDDKKGVGMLAAVDYSGKVVWRQEMTKLVNGSFEYNLSTSPLIYRNLVIMVLAVGYGGGVTVAYDCKTGELKYREPRPVPPWPNRRHILGHNSPVPALLNGMPLVLNNGIGAIEGINPENGKVIWFANQQGGGASLAIGSGIVFGDYACTKWLGSALALDSLAAAKGNITATVQWRPSDDIKGSNPDLGELSSPVIYDGYLYRVVGGNVFCFEAASGKVMYTEKLPGVSFISSPFATADGLVYFASASKSLVVKAGPKFELVATNALGDGEFARPFLHSWRPNGGGSEYPYSSAAVSEGKIFILGCNKLWCIGRR